MKESRLCSGILEIAGSLLCVILISTVFTAAAFGQAADGNLVGSVLEASGAAVPNAKVEIENVGTGVKNTTTADATGFYRFNNLLVGTYKVSASSEGLASANREIVIELNKTATANVA